MKKIAFLLSFLSVVGITGLGFAEPRITACGDRVCREYPTGGGYATGRCTGKSDGDACSKLVAGEKTNICRNFDGTMACAATECSDGWVLWLTNSRNPAPQSQGRCFDRAKMDAWCREGCGCNKGEICVLNEISFLNRGKNVQAFVGEEACRCAKDPNYVPEDKCAKEYLNNPEYGLHTLKAYACCKLKEKGVLVEWNKTTNKCECTEPGKVLEGEQCVDKPVVSECDAITDPEERECCKLRVEQKKPVHWDKDNKICKCDDPALELKDGNCVGKGEEGDCRYTFRGFVRCNGKTVYRFKSFKITPEMARTMKLPSCKDGEIIDVNARFQEDSDEFKKIVAEFCKDPVGNGGIVDNTDDEFIDAQNRIDAFIRNAGLNRSVWKNEDGKFNTSRLASDLTAGVVLGTVGGIVSANVIKKKQLEKGYDALHCAIGGQKVADWGDQFTVGFRQY